MNSIYISCLIPTYVYISINKDIDILVLLLYIPRVKHKHILKQKSRLLKKNNSF